MPQVAYGLSTVSYLTVITALFAAFASFAPNYFSSLETILSKTGVSIVAFVVGFIFLGCFVILLSIVIIGLFYEYHEKEEDEETIRAKDVVEIARQAAEVANVAAQAIEKAGSGDDAPKRAVREAAQAAAEAAKEAAKAALICEVKGEAGGGRNHKVIKAPTAGHKARYAYIWMQQ